MSLPLASPSPRSAWISSATAAPLACAACLLATAAYVVVDDPSNGDGGLTVCPYRAATGLWCPGCGLTRATHHLARGNVVQALSLNLLAPLFLAALIVAWWAWFRVAADRGAPEWLRRIPTMVYVSLGIGVVAFTTVRNMPGFDALRGG